MAALCLASGCGARRTVSDAAVSYVVSNRDGEQVFCLQRFWVFSDVWIAGREIVIRRSELRCEFSRYCAVMKLRLGYKTHTVHLCVL
jgi:hypothetical protein